MKKINIITLLIGFGALAAYLSSSSCHNPKPLTGSNNGDSTHVTTPLSPVMPFDVTLPPPPQRVLETTVRRGFDLFSWDSFIALCWPSKSGQVIGQFGDNATVWETYKKNYQVFLDSGQKPQPWDIGSQTKEIFLSQIGKTPPEMTAIFQPFLTGPLIDQNGQYCRFEIAMNREMFEYINQHTLYNIEGQRSFTDTVIFPEGNNATKKYGAVMVKASWKILGAGDDTSRFHKVKAIIHIAALPSRGIKDTSYEAWVGLVGLHIGTKTVTSPQWIWSTFEQVDNVPDFGKVEKGKHYNFYNEAAGDKALNKAPVQPWNPGIKGQIPSQVARLTPIYTGTQALNDSIHKLLVAINPRNVWQYYELVGTQWPVHPAQSNTGDPFPVYMANATLETYDQGTIKDGKVVYVPGVTSSCIDCHNGSTTWGGRPADFTYLLKTAKAVKK
ncbi:hypothetical protein JN11_03339 [Mucilaginibacter frigoritolerans]|uniref:Cytochrome P460 n=1 Tax=Mucilaginibacter frigoritolerans TaxID=652788 RepID=A0A562TXI3_9SPHI|nr:hypothetical protein [Mucilaginibacter frigoritolerans]TWI97520.1 hypothetical protein JN11_03339 [Mucilaginibacter frigoritolerans]